MFILMFILLGAGVGVGVMTELVRFTAKAVVAIVLYA